MTKSIGNIFPLPSAFCSLKKLFPNKKDEELSILQNMIWSLNHLNGSPVGDGTPCQQRLLGGLMDEACAAGRWLEKAEFLDWGEFFRVKGVDYQGEEVKVARSVSWEMLFPALPSEVGTVALSDVCDAGCKHYVENFENYLLPVEDQVFTKGPKVMVPPGDWEELATNLVQRGICKVIEESEVYHVQDKPLLNGLFGVSKGDWSGEIEAHRLIMNLIPLNRICRGIEGDIATLPSWSSMGPLSLDIDEDLLISSEDVRCFFYIFKVPVSWHRFMAFNRPLPKSLCEGKSGTCYLAATVLPMGFKNSVSIAQHVHRYVLRQGLMNSGRLNGGDQELRRDKPFPSSSNMFRIYLDNFDELTKVNKDLAATLKGELTPTVLALQEAYARWNIPRHPKKAVALQSQAEVRELWLTGCVALPIQRWTRS